MVSQVHCTQLELVPKPVRISPTVPTLLWQLTLTNQLLHNNGTNLNQAGTKDNNGTNLSQAGTKETNGTNLLQAASGTQLQLHNTATQIKSVLTEVNTLGMVTTVEKVLLKL